ncbi:DUF1819 family protein [Siminovitchia fortis]|uniref:DUF1819 family protein n=1 Tax=Siminovitchia fortis TaxID=254758 RepID=UPI0011A1CB7E|nr:DUF1819 family protein [Siminovitchia fortis]
MEKGLKYSSTIKSRPFLYKETKMLAELHLKGLNELELKEKVISQNIFQVKTETRKREIASAIKARLKVLDDYLIRKLLTTDIHTSKLIVLYAILKTDRLFYEFMYEVFSEKISGRDLLLKDRDFHHFFEAKRQQSETVAEWKEYTFYKLKQVYIRILYEAGLLKNQKGDREVSIPMMNPEVFDYIKDSDGNGFIKVLTGGRG